MIAQPHTLMLDSSTLVGMASDFDGTRGLGPLESVLSALDAGDWILVLSAHQCMELLRHEDDRTVLARLRFLHWLAGRPRIGWVSRARDGAGLGTTLDVLAYELQALLKESLTGEQVVEHARRRFFQFGPPPVSEWRDLEQLQPLLRQSMVREREVTSIVSSESLIPSEETIGELRRTDTRSQEDAVNFLRGVVAPHLTQELELRGERRLESPGAVAETFLDDVAQSLVQLDPDMPPIDQVIAHFGLDPADIPDSMSFDDMAYRAEGLTKARIAGPLVGIDRDQIRAEVVGQLPSLRMQERLKRRRLKARNRASGGDNTDTYLAAFALYFDHIVVDKRTAEFLRQMEVSHELELPIGRVSKLGRYEDLPSLIDYHRGT